jgi:hypothetical protein
MSKAKRLRAVDMRASWARRHKALCDAFSADLGDDLSAADRSVVDFAAVIACECEKMRILQVNGETVDLDALVRLANALTRVRRELGQQASTRKKATPTLLQQKLAAEGRRP